MAGYSGTPLAKKLGVKENCAIFTIGAPSGYRRLLKPLPVGVKFKTAADSSINIAHVFETEKDRLATLLASLRGTLSPDAMVWVSWPKRASKMPTTITEETVRELALPIGFVDVKVCAVTEVWSGLKLVVRKALR